MNQILMYKLSRPSKMSKNLPKPWPISGILLPLWVEILLNLNSECHWLSECVCIRIYWKPLVYLIRRNDQRFVVVSYTNPRSDQIILILCSWNRNWYSHCTCSKWSHTSNICSNLWKSTMVQWHGYCCLLFRRVLKILS